jgi:hypothetical protein
MKTIRYFEEQILRKQPHIERAWRAEVLARIRATAGFFGPRLRWRFLLSGGPKGR